MRMPELKSLARDRRLRNYSLSLWQAKRNLRLPGIPKTSGYR